MNTRQGKVDHILTTHDNDIGQLITEVGYLWGVVEKLAKADSINSARIVRDAFEACHPKHIG